MDGEQRRVGVGRRVDAQSASTSTCVPHQNGLKISGLDLANTPYMIMGGNNGMDMNGSDASAAAGLQHDDARLALHGPRHSAGRGERAAGRRQQRAQRHPHGGERLRAEPDGGRRTSVPCSTCRRPARPCRGYADAGGGDGRRVRARVADGLPGRDLREPDHRGGQRGGEADARSPARRRARLRDRRRRAATCSPPPCTSFPSTVTKVPMPYGALVQWHRRTQVCGPATPSPAMPFDITGFPPVRRRHDRAADARTSPWCGRSRWRAGRSPFSRRTSRSWRRP